MNIVSILIKINTNYVQDPYSHVLQLQIILRISFYRLPASIIFYSVCCSSTNSPCDETFAEKHQIEYPIYLLEVPEEFENISLANRQSI